MKNLIAIIFSCFIMIQANAQRSGATLKIRDAEGRKIFLSLNGRKFPKTARVLTINDLPTGNQFVKVYTQTNNGRNKLRLIYSGEIRTQAGYIYRCTVDDYEGMDVQSYCCTNNNGQYFENNNSNGNIGNNNGYAYNEFDQDWDNNQWNGQSHDHDHNGGNNGNGWNNNGGGNNGNGWNNNNNGGNNNGSGWNGNNKGGNNNNGWNNNNNNNNVMNNQSFQAFKQTVANNNFDSGKLTLVKNQLQNTWISSAQLKELVDLFTFESSKLDAAKAGAPKVIDRNNLFTILNSFTYESSKTDFSNFIATLR